MRIDSDTRSSGDRCSACEHMPLLFYVYILQKKKERFQVRAPTHIICNGAEQKREALRQDKAQDVLSSFLFKNARFSDVLFLPFFLAAQLHPATEPKDVVMKCRQTAPTSTLVLPPSPALTTKQINGADEEGKALFFFLFFFFRQKHAPRASHHLID